jgi:NAD(P)-dependent dehydrogenase (short-subunit alcohol dehydrogenase family)
MPQDLDRREFVGGALGAGVLLSGLAAAVEEGTRMAAPVDYPTTVLVTGASRGLGGEFVRQYAPRGWRIIASCRDPGKAGELKALAAKHANVVIERLDVDDHAQIDQLAGKYRDQPIDILLNNAGIGGGAENQLFGKFKYDVYHQVMRTNAEGPMKMAEAFIRNVSMSRMKKLMTVSSSQGSIGKVTSPRLYWYRSSKSALNMMMENLALELKASGVIVGLVTPGATDTDFMKGLPKAMLRKPEVAAADMIRNIDEFTIETTGRFVNYDGTTLPW